MTAAPGPQQPDEVRVELPSGGQAHVSSDAPPSLLRALDALSVAAQQDYPAQSDDVPDGSWIREEFERAKLRQEELPAWARPVITRPAAPSAQPVEACPQCGERLPLDRVCLCCTYTPQRADLKNSHGPWCNGYLIGSCDCATRTPAQPVRDTEEGRR